MKKLTLFLLLIFVMSVSVRATEKILYETNFQNWTAATNPTEGTVAQTTSFTNEAFSFKLLNVSVLPTKTDATKFNHATVSIGALMAEKMATAADPCYIQTTPISSITKIFVGIGATGSNRGYKIAKKADGDADWVDIYTAVANPAQGDTTTIAIPGGTKNVALKFTNLAYSQNAYLFDFKIYGEYTSTATQVSLKDSINMPEAGTITITPAGGSYDQNTSVSLSATRNFGYKFVKWVDKLNNTISTENPYSIVVSKDTAVTAIFEKINTYALNLNVEGGAKTYMLLVSPAPKVINNLNMYEDGTQVTVTASNNNLLTFTNWKSGETNSVQNITMNQDQSLIGVYSSIDYIVGWDFWLPGGSGRIADFFSKPENESSSLILRKEDGTTNSWLDKSQIAAGGYEGSPAAVNWKALTDKYYYQISYNAKDFVNQKVLSSMLLNYNGYSVQKIEYSLDGTSFSTLDSIVIGATKVWTPKTVALPAAADHQEKVYIRWIPNYNSALIGATATNDGTSITGIYVIADEVIANDGIAPVLVSTVPAANATNASATGKVVLTFDEKVNVTTGTMASLNGMTLSPVVSGKTVTFNYVGLNYGSVYNFSLPENSISDLAGNKLSTPISLQFTTLVRPTVAKKKFDFIVGKDGDFKAALTAAAAGANSGNRYHIYIPNGSYDIGTLTGDANQMTTINIPNVSFIGENPDSVTLFNKSILESINSTATIYFASESDNIYMQDIALLNKMDYRTGTLLGRGVALWDKGNKNIYKNVKLLSNQDTYYTGGDRSYLENCEIHGTVDFICGGGDIFFDECLLYLEERSGNCITAPATSGSWGYVFNNCTIDGFDINKGSYRLGRPWSNAPKAQYINTKMKVLPTAEAWGDPMNVVPAVFAEYNSTTASGTPVDMTSRRTSYTKDLTTVTLNPVLTKAQADTYTVENVVGGTDNWLPKLSTEQMAAPVLSGNTTTLRWDDNNYVLCWAVYINGKLDDFTINNSYSISGRQKDDVYYIRAANEMGGLSAPSNTFSPGVVSTHDQTFNNGKILNMSYFTIEGKEIKNLENFQGVLIVKTTFENGVVSSTKWVRTQN